MALPLWADLARTSRKDDRKRTKAAPRQPVIRSEEAMIESVRARQAWADYLGLGPDRSLAKLLERYQSASGSSPTKRLSPQKWGSVAFVGKPRLTAFAPAHDLRVLS